MRRGLNRRRTTDYKDTWKLESTARPNPGKLPLLHRLSRTECENAVRDLPALGALPQEMEYEIGELSRSFDSIPPTEAKSRRRSRIRT